MQYYKAGLEADKRVLQYLPASNTDVSKLLAKVDVSFKKVTLGSQSSKWLGSGG